MIYPTKDSGMAIAEIIEALSVNRQAAEVEIRMTSDELITLVRFNGFCKRAGKRNEAQKSSEKGSDVDKKRRNVPITCGGKSMTAKEWAKKLGVSNNTLYTRMKKYGNPYGLKGPTNKDKIISGLK